MVRSPGKRKCSFGSERWWWEGGGAESGHSFFLKKSQLGQGLCWVGLSMDHQVSGINDIKINVMTPCFSFWNNFRFTESCKDSTEWSLPPASPSGSSCGIIV